MFSRPPVAKHRLLSTRDPHVASNIFSREFAPHNIEVIGRPKLFHSLAHKAHFASIDLYHTCYGPEVRIRTEALRSHYLVYIPLTGRVRVTTDGRTIEVSPGQIVIVNPFAGYSLHRLDDCTQLALKIRRADLDQHAYMSFGRSPDRPIKFRTDRPISFEECPNLIRLIDLIQSDVFNSDGRLSGQLCGAPAEALLARLLLNEIPNSCTALIDAQNAGPVPHYVKKVEDHIFRNATHKPSMRRLIEVSGVSARALFRGFLMFRGVSPMRYAKNVRLDHIRAELIAMRAGETARRTVTEIAGEWGFVHLGNFSNEYKARFGERPSETVRGH